MAVSFRNGKLRRFAFEDNEAAWNFIDVVILNTIDEEPNVEISAIKENGDSELFIAESYSNVIEMLEKILSFLKNYDS
ncbi:hypothetical protein DRP07_00735 [Archaeoglobales archaeon]|nr:MAG: hypothetical protein DRP07_00735 [Archaeoglobales archaeon]